MHYRVIKPVLSITFESSNVLLDVLKDILEAADELESESFVTFKQLDEAVYRLKEYSKSTHGIYITIDYTYYDETIEENDDWSRKGTG